MGSGLRKDSSWGLGVAPGFGLRIMGDAKRILWGVLKHPFNLLSMRF